MYLYLMSMPRRIAGIVWSVLRTTGRGIFQWLGMVAVRLLTWVVIASVLVLFFVLAFLLPELLSPFGVSGQTAVALAGVVAIAAFWVGGIKLWFWLQ